MKTFFTADTHFGQERTRLLSCRPFDSVEEMDETIIKNWNNTVSPEDEVYHLGDFGDYSKSKELNGKIHLIFGNYELKEKKDNFNNSFEEFLNYLNNFKFDCIYSSSGEIFINNEDVHMTHEPGNCKKDKFNLFGHVHQLCMVKKYGLNVGVDCHFFKPIDTDTVLFYKNAIQNHYDFNVFE